MSDKPPLISITVQAQYNLWHTWVNMEFLLISISNLPISVWAYETYLLYLGALYSYLWTVDLTRFLILSSSTCNYFMWISFLNVSCRYYSSSSSYITRCLSTRGLCTASYYQVPKQIWSHNLGELWSWAVSISFTYYLSHATVCSNMSLYLEYIILVVCFALYFLLLYIYMGMLHFCLVVF